MKNKKVVVIGGGNGLSRLLRGLKYIPNIDISAVVTVADDGGSTGTLRSEYELPAMGDIRRVIGALSFDRPLLEEVMEFRFGKEAESTGNHSLGNLIITAMAKSKGSFSEGVAAVSSILNIKGDVIPSSDENITLMCKYKDGSTGVGEHSIPTIVKDIDHVYYNGRPKANEAAVAAIENADYIIFSMGSLFTSILANVALPEIRAALLRNTSAQAYYFANIVTQHGETDNMTLADHVETINRHVGKDNYVNKVFKTDISVIPKKLLKKYMEAEQSLIIDDSKGKAYEVITVDLLDDSEENFIRHSDYKTAREIGKYLK